MKTRNIEMAGAGFDAFALVGEQQADGARLLRDRQEREQAAAELAKRQTGFDFFSSQEPEPRKP